MDFNTLTTTLDTNFQRNVTQATNYPTGISYLNTANYDITINNTTYTNPQQICLLAGTEGVILYVNTIKGKYHKTNIADITNLQMEE